MDNFFELFSEGSSQAPEVEDGGLVYEVDGECFRLGGLRGAVSSYYTSEDSFEFVDMAPPDITPEGVWDERGDAHLEADWNWEDRGDSDWI